MTTLLLVFVTLRVITAAISVEVSGEDIPVCLIYLAGTEDWTRGLETKPGTDSPGA